MNGWETTLRHSERQRGISSVVPRPLQILGHALVVDGNRFFAEFILSSGEGLRMTELLRMTDLR